MRDSNKPQINGVSLTGNKTGADLGVLDLSGGTMTGDISWGNDIRIGRDIPGLSITAVDGTIFLLYGTTGSSVARRSDISAAALSATNYTDASISPTSPAFSNAVLSVGLGIDTNTVAAINELVDSAHDLPVSGATSVGALLLALAAAIAALKKNLRYSFNDVTVSNGSTTLADRAVNRLQLSSSLAGLNVVFPAAAYATMARDFFLRIDLGSGVSLLDVSFSLPSGEQNTLYLENSSGELPEIPEGGSTILYFSETTSGRFLVKAEELMTISQEDQE